MPMHHFHRRILVIDIRKRTNSVFFLFCYSSLHWGSISGTQSYVPIWFQEVTSNRIQLEILCFFSCTFKVQPALSTAPTHRFRSRGIETFSAIQAISYFFSPTNSFWGLELHKIQGLTPRWIRRLLTSRRTPSRSGSALIGGQRCVRDAPWTS